MIIFTPLQFIPMEYLEYKGIRQVVKYNLSSYYNDAPTLNELIPNADIPEEVLQGDCTGPEFDIAYHNYILNNPASFMQFMSLIVPAYTDPDVLVQVMIRPSRFRDILTESLLKLIQQRYGYNVYVVNELEDFLYVDESDFSIPGLFNMDQDVARWQSMNPQLEVQYE